MSSVCHTIHTKIMTENKTWNKNRVLVFQSQSMKWKISLSIVILYVCLSCCFRKHNKHSFKQTNKTRNRTEKVLGSIQNRRTVLLLTFWIIKGKYHHISHFSFFFALLELKISFNIFGWVCLNEFSMIDIHHTYMQFGWMKFDSLMMMMMKTFSQFSFFCVFRWLSSTLLLS